MVKVKREYKCWEHGGQTASEQLHGYVQYSIWTAFKGAQTPHFLWKECLEPCWETSVSKLIYSWVDLYLYAQAEEDGGENKIEEETGEEVAAVERNMSLRSRTTILSTKTMTSSIEMGENSIEEEGDEEDEENEQVFSEVGEQNNQKDNIVLNWLENR